MSPLLSQAHQALLAGAAGADYLLRRVVTAQPAQKMKPVSIGSATIRGVYGPRTNTRARGGRGRLTVEQHERRKLSLLRSDGLLPAAAELCRRLPCAVPRTNLLVSNLGHAQRKRGDAKQTYRAFMLGEVGVVGIVLSVRVRAVVRVRMSHSCVAPLSGNFRCP